MTLYHYIDNEPATGEWTSKTETGGSTITRSADAAFPERGDYGLRVLTTGGRAQMNLTTSITVAAGGDLFIGFWYCHRADPGDPAYAGLLTILQSGTFAGLLLYRSPLDYLRIYAYNDAGASANVRDYEPPPTDRWSYVVARFHRATTDVSADGYAALYVDGVLTAQTANIDNFDCLASIDEIRLGEVGYNPTGWNVDLDEIKIADAYPEPYAAPPDDEYPSAARTLILYRQASADSREFADYCVTELGVPRANLVRLDNASANETLADYATFQTELETDLAAYLTRHPTLAGRAMTFLIGYGVPGYFTAAAVKHSAASRLMNYGTAFASQTANPLYNPDPVARLTKTDLGGKYLATRIDADSIANAKALIDRAATVAALTTLTDDDTLYSDDDAYLASLPAQRLRILTAALTTFADDAFIFGDTGTPAFGSAGSRAAFIDDSADAAASLRSAAAACAKALLTAGYAAALGASETADGFDAEAFFEMLRIGGTFAEAVAVAVEHIDYTAVPVGSPLLTVAFERGGYNIYRGAGSADTIDWTDPVACVRPGQQMISFGQVLAPGERHVYAARAVSADGVEEHNTHVVAYLEQANGDLAGPPLARPRDLTADVLPTGDLLVGFSYHRPVGFATPDGFDILSDNGTGQIDLDNPVATINDAEEEPTDYEVLITAPETSVHLAVRARLGEKVGPLSEIVFVPLSAPPAPPMTL